jgi:hypothetical protein
LANKKTLTRRIGLVKCAGFCVASAAAFKKQISADDGRLHGPSRRGCGMRPRAQSRVGLGWTGTLHDATDTLNSTPTRQIIRKSKATDRIIDEFIFSKFHFHFQDRQVLIFLFRQVLIFHRQVLIFLLSRFHFQDLQVLIFLFRQVLISLLRFETSNNLAQIKLR